MVDSVFMAELSWPEFERKVAAERSGDHPARGDRAARAAPAAAMSTSCCRPASPSAWRRRSAALVAPTIPYGYKSQPRSGGGEAFPGTTSLDAQTFALVVRDIIRDLAAHGVRRIVVLNGHFENSWPSVEGVDLGLREVRRDGIADMQVLRLEYWDFVRRATLDRLFPDGFPGTELEHASLLETSLMLLLAPRPRRHGKGALRRAGEIPDLRHAAASRRFRLAGLGRAGGGARAPRPRRGSWLMNDHVELIAAAIRKEFSL